MMRQTIVAILASLFSLDGYARSEAKKFSVLQIIPKNPTQYAASRAMTAIEKTAALAISDFKKGHPTCSFEQEFIIKTGTEGELYKAVQVASAFKGRKAAIGFSRSSLARLASKAASGSDLVGISIGASSDDLQQYNPNFVSIAAPWRRQWLEIRKELAQQSCGPKNSLVISETKDSYSFNFLEAALKEGFDQSYEFDSVPVRTHLQEIILSFKCIFLAMNISSSHELLAKIMKSTWTGALFGTGDWYYYKGELNETLKFSSEPSLLQIIIPTGGEPGTSLFQRKIVHRIQSELGYPPDPISIYTYDATQVALGHLCLNFDLKKINSKNSGSLRLLRSYDGLSEGGNFLSPIHLVRLNSR